MFSLSCIQNENQPIIPQEKRLQHKSDGRMIDLNKSEELVHKCLKTSKTCNHTDCIILCATAILSGKSVNLIQCTLLEKLTHKLWYSDNISPETKEFIDATVLRAQSLVTIYQINFFDPLKTFTKKNLRNECKIVAERINSYILNSNKYTREVRNECLFFYLLFSLAFKSRKFSEIRKNLDKLLLDLTTPFYIRSQINEIYKNERQTADKKTLLFFAVHLSEKPEINVLVDNINHLIVTIKSLIPHPLRRITYYPKSRKKFVASYLNYGVNERNFVKLNIKELKKEMEQIFNIVKKDNSINICRRFSQDHLEFLKKQFKGNAKISQLFLIGELNIKISQSIK